MAKNFLKDKNFLLLLGGIFVIFILAFNLGLLTFFTGTIVNVSEIDVSGDGSIITANIVANANSEKIWVIPKESMTEDIIGNKIFEAKRDIRFSISPERPSCDYVLTTQTQSLFGAPLYSWYQIGGNEVKHTPVDIRIDRGSENQSGGFVTVGSTTLDTFFNPVYNYNNSSVGTVKITNLGEFSSGVQCPPGASDIAIIPINAEQTQFKVVSRSAYQTKLNNQITSCGSGDITGCVISLGLGVQEPAGVNICSDFTSCQAGFYESELINFINSGELTYRLPFNSSPPSLVFTADSDFVSGFVFDSPVGRAEVNLNQDSYSSDEGTLVDITGNITNVGEVDSSFTLIASSQNNTVSIIPNNILTPLLNANGTYVFSFTGSFNSPGVGEICVRAIPSSQLANAGDEDIDCALSNVNDVTDVTPIFGGPTIPETQLGGTEEDVVDNTDVLDSALCQEGDPLLFLKTTVVSNQKIPQYLLGLNFFGLGIVTGEETVPSAACIFDPVAVGTLILLLLIIIGLALLLLSPNGRKLLGLKRLT